MFLMSAICIVFSITIVLMVIFIWELVKPLWYRSKIYSTVKTFFEKSQRSEIPLAVQRALRGNQKGEELPEWMDKWIKQINVRIKKSGVNIPIGRYVLGIFLGGFVGLIIGIAVLRNPVVAVILGFSAFLIPDVILVGFMQKRRMKIIDQLGSAVRIFSAEYADTPQVPRALHMTAKRIPAPLGTLITKASRDLSTGKSKEEVFVEMAKELDFDYGRLFVHLLLLAWDDAAVKPLFARLATRISSLQSLMQKNNSSLAYGRIMAMGVNALIIPMLFLVQWKVPGAREFMVGHPGGRLLVTLSFLSVLVGLILDRVLSGVKV